jgi:lauroyl/myristoyl acyltransferase
LKGLVLGGLRLLARCWPRAGVAVAHTLAALTRPLGHGIADESLARTFPDLSPSARRAARRSTWASFLKGEALDAAVRHRSGRRAYPRLVPSAVVGELRPPLILASFHVGPHQALAAVLRALPAEAVGIDRGQFAPRRDFTLMPAGEDEWERARTFQGALQAIRSGAFVFVNLDGQHPDEFDVSTIDVPVLGGTLPLARGAFALARITGTPILPLVARWRGTAVEVIASEAIAPSANERDMALAVASWIDRYLTEQPGEISVFLLERLRV